VHDRDENLGMMETRSPQWMLAATKAMRGDGRAYGYAPRRQKLSATIVTQKELSSSQAIETACERNEMQELQPATA